MLLFLRPSTKLPLLALITLSLLLSAVISDGELYIGDLSVTNNLVFSNMDVKQAFQCQNLLINTMSAATIKVNSLTMGEIYTEEILNSGSDFITLRGSLNVRGSMSWNPEAAAHAASTAPSEAPTGATGAPITPGGPGATQTIETTHVTETMETVVTTETTKTTNTTETTEVVPNAGSASLEQNTQEVQQAGPTNLDVQAVEEENLQVSFLKVDSLVLNGVKQWAMIDHENFDNMKFSMLQMNSNEINGWRVKGGEQKNYESVMPAKLGSIYSSNKDDKALLTSHSNVIFKEFRKLPSHKSLMVEAQLLLHAPVWKGEAAFAKVNNKLVWLQHYDSGEIMHDNCEISEDSWQRIPISFNLQHNEDSVLVEIGTNNPSQSYKNCAGVLDKAVFGLDDFVMYVK